MIVSMKPRISLPYSDDSITYSLGVSTILNSMDQKLDVIDLEPGLHTVISVTPQSIQTTKGFDELSPYSRNCRLPHETTRLMSFKNYSRTACEHECAFKKAVSLCKCAPWYYRNESSTVPICEMFGGYCFNRIMSDRNYYKACSEECLEDCNGIQLSWEKSFRPINIDKICKRGNVMFEFLKKSENQHFSQNYYNRWKLATEDYRQFEELHKIMKDGNMSDHYVTQCMEYVEKYIAIVTIETPTNVVTLTLRDVEASFAEKVAIFGGEIGLFTGFTFFSIIEMATTIYKKIWPANDKTTTEDTLKSKKKKKTYEDQIANDKRSNQRRLHQLEREMKIVKNERLDRLEREMETLKNENKDLREVCRYL